MGKNNFVKSLISLKAMLALLVLLAVMASPLRANAVDLPLATASPLSGVQFDDRPLVLPVQRNFQMAMLTASSELGRSCGRMEAYGWRMTQSEQPRVNQIFNTTVNHLREMGYGVEAQAPTSVSRDITMFTADRNDHHFIFMWSAGELGLVMVLCEASQPMHYRNATASQPSVQVFQQPQGIIQSTLDAPPHSKIHGATVSNFTPVGDWVGGYTCEQGYTGGTLQIAHLKGENFDGYFRFYPTPKNPYVPTGRYSVYGQYDRASQRILINPGKWLQRPKDFYNTIMVGSFDPIARTFSAYFQGISGCTSFEAHAATEDYQGLGGKVKKHVKKKPKKKVAKKKAEVQAAPVSIVAPTTDVTAPVAVAPTAPVGSAVPEATPTAAVPVANPAPVAPLPPAPAGIVLPAPTPTPAPAAAPPAPAATDAPVSITPPTVAPPAPPPAQVAPPEASVAPPAQVAPPAPTAAPAQTAPPAQVAPPPQVAPSPTTTPDQATKPSGALEPRHSPKLIEVASNSPSGQWFTPTVPQAQQNTYVSPAPTVQPAQIAPVAQIAPPANTFQPNPPQVPPAAIAPQAVMYNVNPQQVPAAPIAPQPQTAPEATRFQPTPQQVPPPDMVPDYQPVSKGLQGGPETAR